eukprot:3639197-Rhodomonas_salina.2
MSASVLSEDVRSLVEHPLPVPIPTPHTSSHKSAVATCVHPVTRYDPRSRGRACAPSVQSSVGVAGKVEAGQCCVPTQVEPPHVNRMYHPRRVRRQHGVWPLIQCRRLTPPGTRTAPDPALIRRVNRTSHPDRQLHPIRHLPASWAGLIVSGWRHAPVRAPTPHASRTCPHHRRRCRDHPLRDGRCPRQYQDQSRSAVARCPCAGLQSSRVSRGITVLGHHFVQHWRDGGRGWLQS